MTETGKPDILYRKSRCLNFLYLRVPDEDTEKEGVLTFNRLMADLGFPDPKEIFNKLIGVAVVPVFVRVQERRSLIRIRVMDEIEKYFNVLPISDKVWFTKRF